MRTKWENYQKLKDGVYWNGKEVKYPIKKDVLEPHSIKNLDWKNLLGLRNIGMLLMLFVYVFTVLAGAYAYYNDTKECFNLLENPIEYCMEYGIVQPMPICTEEDEKLGLCLRKQELDFDKLENISIVVGENV